MDLKAAFEDNESQILTIGGLIGLGVTVVLSCRATLKARKIIEEHKAEREDYDKETRKNDYEVDRKDIAKMYGKTGLRLLGAYALPIGLGIASTACILGGYHILSEENVKLTNELAAETTMYNELVKFTKKYRKNVIADAGEEKDKEYAYGLKSDKVETVDPETGKKVRLDKTLHSADGSKAGDPGKFRKLAPYSFEFNEAFTEFRSSNPSNKSFLATQQNYWNDIYNSRKNQSMADGKMHPIYLNEVLDSLGSPERVNPRIGWNPCDSDSDGFIDFGYFNYLFPMNEAYKNGYTSKCMLSFNCDGDVSDAEGAPVYDQALLQK